LERRRKEWGLLGTRQEKHTFHTIAPFVKEVKDWFPTMGARLLVAMLHQDYRLKVSEYVCVLSSYNNLVFFAFI